jgi:rRNA maturation endonuclease Nob1
MNKSKIVQIPFFAIRCGNCGNLVEEEGYLSVSAYKGHHIDGICPICGEPFNLTSATKAEKW